MDLRNPSSPLFYNTLRREEDRSVFRKGRLLVRSASPSEHIAGANVKRRTVPITLIVPDASPLLSLGRVGRLDILGAFTVPIHIVDVVAEEAQRPENDLNEAVRAWLDGKPNNVQIEETVVGAGLRHQRGRGLHPSTGNLGEIAVDEYATRLAKQGDPNIVPMVLFEDPDVLELRIARLANVHLINTAAMLTGLQALGVLNDGTAVLDEINALRTTPMRPIERSARTRKIESSLRGAARPTLKEEPR